MKNKKLNENGFEGAPSGNGMLNYGQSYGTYSSPDVSQTPDAFTSSNQNKAVNQMGNTVKDAPKSGSSERDLSAIYAKKDTPTPDEVICGIKYELGQQIKKDKHKAKEEVLKNLRKDPHFYGGLKMLNIDDKTMTNNMNENKHPNDSPAKIKINSNSIETNKIFTEMAVAKDSKFVVNSHLVDVMKEMWEAKKNRRMWKKGDPTL